MRKARAGENDDDDDEKFWLPFLTAQKQLKGQIINFDFDKHSSLDLDALVVGPLQRVRPRNGILGLVLGI